jgi:RNA polymerase sigma factor
MPFIKKCTADVFFKKQARQDNLTEAMLAFAHSVQTYDPNDGTFIAYAGTVIRNRLIDAARKEIKIQKPLFSLSAAVDEKDIQWEQDTARRSYDRAEEQKNLQSEINDINAEFAPWGFEWTKLAKNGPKQKRSRRTCHIIARKALENSSLVAGMLRTHQLPIKELSAITGFSEKILEKYRQYIAAIIMILEGDYPYIHSFLPHLDEEELS